MTALCWLVPEVYGLFPDIVVGHPKILHIIVAAIDAQQLQDIVYLVLQVLNFDCTLFNFSCLFFLFSYLTLLKVKWH